MTAGLPAVLADQRRRLADVARPAGRSAQQHRRVVFRSTPCGLQQPTALWMAGQLEVEIGPTRVGPIAVEGYHGRDAVTAALLEPRFAGQPAEDLAAALAGYDAAVDALGCAALLVAHSLVLWPQRWPAGRWLLA